MNTSHVRSVGGHEEDEAQSSELARAADELRAVQDRTVERTERLVKRLSDRPSAMGGTRR
jgi:hypothetical protein